MRSKYRSDMPALVGELVAIGCKDDKTIAKALGVSASTMWAWTKRNPEFAAALASVYQNPPKRDVKAAHLENRMRDFIARSRRHRASANKPTDANHDEQ